MLKPEVALYLPISQRLLTPFLDEAADIQAALAALDVPQIASLVVLQYLARSREERSLSTESVLINAIRGGNQHVRQTGLADLRTQICSQIDRAKIYEGHRKVAGLRILLLEDEALTHRGYLTSDGEWDGGFMPRHNVRAL